MLPQRPRTYPEAAIPRGPWWVPGREAQAGPGQSSCLCPPLPAHLGLALLLCCVLALTSCLPGTEDFCWPLWVLGLGPARELSLFTPRYPGPTPSPLPPPASPLPSMAQGRALT